MREPEYADIAEAIRAGRAVHKLSQSDLANLIGLSRVSITNFEACTQRLQWHHLIKLCKISGIRREVMKLLRNP